MCQTDGLFFFFSRMCLPHLRWPGERGEGGGGAAREDHLAWGKTRYTFTQSYTGCGEGSRLINRDASDASLGISQGVGKGTLLSQPRAKTEGSNFTRRTNGIRIIPTFSLPPFSSTTVRSHPSGRPFSLSLLDTGRSLFFSALHSPLTPRLLFSPSQRGGRKEKAFSFFPCSTFPPFFFFPRRRGIQLPPASPFSPLFQKEWQKAEEKEGANPSLSLPTPLCLLLLLLFRDKQPLAHSSSPFPSFPSIRLTFSL